jgi:sulfonate transport system substrate-binding protein
MQRNAYGPPRGEQQGSGSHVNGTVCTVIATLCCCMILALLPGCPQTKPAKKEPTTVESVKLCRSTTMLLLLVVAEKKGYFTSEGLSVEVKEFPIGKEALEGLVNNTCDFSSAAEPPVVESALSRDDFRIISALQISDNLSRIIARSDRGIRMPSDLIGKRIATVKGTAPHYFLDMYLKKNGIASNQVTIKYLKANALLPALRAGTVDAISMTNRMVLQAQQELGQNAVLLEAPGLCRNYYMLMTTTRLLQDRPEVALKFLRALTQAEELIKRDPDQAKELARSYQKVTPEDINHLWDFYQHRLYLETAMVMGLEETARWTLEKSPNNRLGIPNMTKLIHSESLRAVNPSSVVLNK